MVGLETFKSVIILVAPDAAIVTAFAVLLIIIYCRLFDTGLFKVNVCPAPPVKTW